MCDSHDVLQRTFEKLAKHFSISEEEMVKLGFEFIKTSKDEINEKINEYIVNKAKNKIDLDTVSSTKDERLQQPFDLENVTYKGMSASEILEIVDVENQIEYLGFSIKTKRWVIGARDEIIFYKWNKGCIEQVGEYDYEDDEETIKHKKHYYFYDDAYNRMKKIDDGVVDIMLD